MLQLCEKRTRDDQPVKEHGKKGGREIKGKRRIRKEGGMQGEKRRAGRKIIVERARPREMGALRHLVCQGIIKGDEGSAINGSARRRGQVDMAVWGTHFPKAT